MNWFEPVFWASQASRSGWIYDAPFVGEGALLGLLLMGIALLARRSVPPSAMLACFLSGFALSYSDWLGSFVSLSIGLSQQQGMISGNTLAYVVSGLVGAFLVALSMFRRSRSLCRLATGTGLVASFTLLYSYHIFLINGQMKTVIRLEAEKHQQILGASPILIRDYCDRLSLQCYVGDIANLPEIDNTWLSHEFTTYREFYRHHPNAEGIISFHSSNVLLLRDSAYAMAYLEHESHVRRIIDRQGPIQIADAARSTFFFFANLATLFWSGFAVAVILLHQRMLRKRRGKTTE